MREELKKIGFEERHTFTAIVEKFSLKNGFRGLPLRTILLTNVMHEGIVVANHVWLTCGKRFYSAILLSGDLIQFDARIKEYEKDIKVEEKMFINPLKKTFAFHIPLKSKC